MTICLFWLNICLYLPTNLWDSSVWLSRFCIFRQIDETLSMTVMCICYPPADWWDSGRAADRPDGDAARPGPHRLWKGHLWLSRWGQGWVNESRSRSHSYWTQWCAVSLLHRTLGFEVIFTINDKLLFCLFLLSSRRGPIGLRSFFYGWFICLEELMILLERAWLLN